MNFEDLPRPLRFVEKIDGDNDIPAGWMACVLGDVPEGYRELTDENLKGKFASENK
jgi:hypothetical protein